MRAHAPPRVTSRSRVHVVLRSRYMNGVLFRAGPEQERRAQNSCRPTETHYQRTGGMTHFEWEKKPGTRERTASRNELASRIVAEMAARAPVTSLQRAVRKKSLTQSRPRARPPPFLSVGHHLASSRVKLALALGQSLRPLVACNLSPLPLPPPPPQHCVVLHHRRGITHAGQ